MSAPATNVLAITLLALRLKFLQRCWITVLSIAAYTLLFTVDWRIALAVFALETARNTWMGMMGGGASQ